LSTTTTTSAFLPPSFRTTHGGSTTTTTTLHPRSNKHLQQPSWTCRSRLWAKEDDDDFDDDFDDDTSSFDPLSKGLESVKWIGPMKDLPYYTEEEVLANPSSKEKDTSILPLFPLGQYVYTPNSEHVLNIFEPRYRQMYSDILMNGSKRFVVCMNHPNEAGVFAKTGVLFELEELKEVSEQTQDKVKYVCSHKLTGRVELHRILNPQSWEKADTYLKVEGTITYDNEMEPNPSTNSKDKGAKESPLDMWATCAVLQEEVSLQKAFEKLVDAQHEESQTEEPVRFTKASVKQLGTKNGPGPFGIWETVRLWQSFADQRLLTRRTQMQEDFQERLQEYLRSEQRKKNPSAAKKKEPLPSAVEFKDLPLSFQKEIRELEKRMQVELKPLVLEQMLGIQACLEAPSHVDRCRLLTHFFDSERKRLTARRSLEGIFKMMDGTNNTTTTATTEYDENIPKEELLLDDDEATTMKDDSTDMPPPPTSSLLSDEEDAFQ